MQDLRRQTFGEALEEEAHRFLLARLRAGAWVALTSITLFGIADFFVRPGQRASLALVKLIQLVVILTGFYWLRARRPRAFHIWIGVFAVVGLHVMNAVKGVLTDDITVPILMFVIIIMGAASALPWGGLPQFVSSVIGAVAVAVAYVAVTGNAQVLLGYPGVVLVVGTIGATYFARELERTRVERQLVGALLAGQSLVLEHIAANEALPRVLEELCGVIDGQAEGSACVVLTREGDQLQLAAAPGLDRARALALPDLSDAPSEGTWGASAPILANDGAPLGVVALVRTGKGLPPNGRTQQLLATAAHLARLSIERRRAEAALRVSRLRLQQEADVSSALVRVGREVIALLDAPRLLERLCQLTVELAGSDRAHAWLLDVDPATLRAVSSHARSGHAQPSAGARITLEELRGIDAEELVSIAEWRLPPNTGAALRDATAGGFALFVPLRGPRALAGVLSASFTQSEAIVTEAQRRIVRGIGQIASLALANATLVEELERASRLKSEFVSTMSHEFRTPLNVVIGYADILGEEGLEPDLLDYVKRIRNAGRELLEMIEATLDLSRIESGNAPPRIETFDTTELFDELEAEFAAVRRPESPRLVWQPCPPFALRSDRRKLKIVLKNLVGNALKFTPQGTVAVAGRVEDGRFGFTVRDSGIGIPSDALPSIFEMFRQVDSSDTRSYGGVGLGLYIVRRLVDQIGASIRVESTVGEGTTFDVLLPAEPPPHDAERTAGVAPPAASGTR